MKCNFIECKGKPQTQETQQQSKDEVDKVKDEIDKIMSDEDFARVVGRMGEKVATLARAGGGQVGKLLYFSLLTRLGTVKDKKKRESLRQDLVKQVVTLQQLGAVSRAPEVKGQWSNVDVKKRIYEILKQPKPGALATLTEDGKPWVRYVILVTDENLNVMLTTFKNSRKISQIKKNPEVHVCFKDLANETDIEYIQIQGKARVSDDPKLKQSLWEPYFWGYFTGPEDPNYAVVIVEPYRAELWNMATLKLEQKPLVWEP